MTDGFNDTWRHELEMIVAQHLGGTFPAAALCVLVDGQPILDEAWGWVDPDTMAQPVTPDTLFDLASVTKLFTMTAFLSLLSEGAANLSDSLSVTIPEFSAVQPRSVDGGMDPHDKIPLPTPDNKRALQVDPATVTLYHLLTHTSGLAPWRDVFNAAGDAPPPPDQPDPIGREERFKRALDALCHYPFVSTADGVVRYSDLGLMLLGEATSRLHGRGGRLDDAIRDRVLVPLGIDETMVFNPVREHDFAYEQIAPTEDDPTWRMRRVWGEVHDENACGIGGVAGHAGLFGTAHDLARFGQAWLSGAEKFGIRDDLAVRATQLQEASGAFRHGLGWMMKTPEGSSAGTLFDNTSYGHTGFTGTSLWIDPTRGLVVALLTNRVYPGRERVGVHAFRRAVHDHIAQGADA